MNWTEFQANNSYILTFTKVIEIEKSYLCFIQFNGYCLVLSKHSQCDQRDENTILSLSRPDIQHKKTLLV